MQPFTYIVNFYYTKLVVVVCCWECFSFSFGYGQMQTLNVYELWTRLYYSNFKAKWFPTKRTQILWFLTCLRKMFFLLFGRRILNISYGLICSGDGREQNYAQFKTSNFDVFCLMFYTFTMVVVVVVCDPSHGYYNFNVT